ncbi:MAG TPA: hypothetical protein VNL73_01890 [Verrucomicrobiae bacterium]|nr:hypothetical protein [Verrucomicrobiae bacterium]
MRFCKNKQKKSPRDSLLLLNRGEFEAFAAGGAEGEGGTQEVMLLTQEETVATDLQDSAVVVIAGFDDHVQPGLDATATDFSVKIANDSFRVIFAKVAAFDFTLPGIGGFLQIGVDFAEIRAHE